MSNQSVVVVGAGVIGLSIAIAARMRGLPVAVLDREGPAAGASAGNAGSFAFGEILPLASPGILRQAPKWLLDPLGPLTIPPSYALSIAPWMFRFWRACAPKNVAHSTASLAALMHLSKVELEPFLEQTGTIGMLRKRGNLHVYEGEAQERAALSAWNVRGEHGIEFRHLDQAGMADIQPGLSPRFTRGIFTPNWFSIADPKLYTLALAEHFRSIGGTIERSEASAVRPLISGVEITSADGATRVADKIVVAAGAFSHRIARTMNERIPLETERGYNTTLPSDSFDLRTQITFGGHGFVVSSLSTGIRVGGAVELGGLSLRPNFRRAEAMLIKAKRFLPSLKTAGGAQWMGFRPSLPDSLPVIGFSRTSPRVLYAFGHGHVGLTQSAGTARVIADLVTGAAPPINIAPFSSQRF